jgi:hypothetical protein
MADTTLPYMQAYGNITKGLDKIQTAAEPPRFTVDFLEQTLAMKGGSARPLISYLKRTGFLRTDGTPTETYKRFRNPASRGAAAAAALKQGYAPLYQIAEQAHTLAQPELKGVIMQATGLEADSSVVRAVQGSFKALAAFADFSTSAETDPGDASPDASRDGGGLPPPAGPGVPGLALGYTINLHLPPTSDIAVFDAIFKSLREHILPKP